VTLLESADQRMYSRKRAKRPIPAPDALP